MKSFKDYFPETEIFVPSIPVVFAFVRMNPPHMGHGLLVNRVRAIAGSRMCTHEIVVSHKQDSNKNPLPVETKLAYLNEFFPDTNFVGASDDAPDFLAHVAKLNQSGFNELVMVAGGDRVDEYRRILEKYNGQNYNFKHIDVVSCGERDEDYGGVEGCSATKMRQYAKEADYKSFRASLPYGVSETTAEKLFSDVRRHMGLFENVNRHKSKAVFLIGGPNSGKDIFLSQLGERLVELDLNQIHAYLVEGKETNGDARKENKKYAIHSGQGILVNGSASEYSKIAAVKESLEKIGYGSMMVFVHVSNEESQRRNLLRESKGAKVLDEFIREGKWTTAYNNVVKFDQLFESKYYFTNETNEDFEDRLLDAIIEVKEFLGKPMNIDDLFEKRFNNLFEEEVVKPNLKKKYRRPEDSRLPAATGGIGDTTVPQAGGQPSAPAGLGGRILESLQKHNLKRKD